MAESPFQILEILATGTYGTVCSALDTRRPQGDNLVALKILKAELVGDRRFMGRIRAEARLLQLLDHPNIIEVLELAEIDGRPVVVMELVRGIEIDELLEEDPEGASGPVVLEVIRQTALALDAGWSTPGPDGTPIHIVHRDIKPSNIMLSVDGVVKLLDFGLATGEVAGKEDLTDGDILGTLGFLAPEILKGRPCGAPGDIYALGMALHELLTGRLLDVREVTGVHDLDKLKGLVDFRAKGLDAEVQRRCLVLIDRMCAFLPDDRPTAAEVARDIGALGVSVDLERFARKTVLPLLEARHRVGPEDHPEYREIARLAGDPQATVDMRLRVALGRPGWWTRTGSLAPLLRRHDPPGPLLELLERSTRPWWKVWVRPPYVEEIVTAIGLLRTWHASPEVRRAVRPFQGHRNPEIAEAAAQVMAR